MDGRLKSLLNISNTDYLNKMITFAETCSPKMSCVVVSATVNYDFVTSDQQRLMKQFPLERDLHVTQL